MKRLFIETNVFKKLIDEFDDENIERTVKDELLKDPQKGDLIKGTGGFRKIRVGKKKKGKSGGYRIIYFDVSEFEIIYLHLIFDKKYKIDLNSNEKKWLKEEGLGIKRDLRKLGERDGRFRGKKQIKGNSEEP